MQHTDASPSGLMPTPIIRVFADAAEVPVMDIVELQGRIVITDDALSAARAERAQRDAARLTRGRRSGAANVSRAGADEAAETKQPAGITDVSDRVNAASAHGLTVARDDEDGTLHTGGAVSDTTQVSSASSSDCDEDSDVDDVGAPGGASASSNACASAAVAATHSAVPTATDVVEVPLGHVEQDRLSEKRCTLCVDTLRVNGSRSSFKHPWLVLRECTARRMASLRRRLDVASSPTSSSTPPPPPQGGTASHDDAETVDGSNGDDAQPSRSPADSSSTLLFSDWLQQHPEALSLDALFLDDITATQGRRGGAAAGAASRVDGATRKRARSTDAEAHASAPSSPGAGSGNSVVGLHTSALVAGTAATSGTVGGAAQYKNYELVGIVRGSVLFNSKPARVFQ